MDYNWTKCCDNDDNKCTTMQIKLHLAHREKMVGYVHTEPTNTNNDGNALKYWFNYNWQTETLKHYHMELNPIQIMMSKGYC